LGLEQPPLGHEYYAIKGKKRRNAMGIIGNENTSEEERKKMVVCGVEIAIFSL
jgi:hypothetical protein